MTRPSPISARSSAICADLLAGVTSGPRPIHLLERLALAHYNIATILMEFERPMAALEELGRSLAYREALATAHPSVFRYQLDLGTSLGEIAGLQHQAKQDGKALVTIERSIDVLEKLVGSRPEDTRFRAGMGRSWNTLGFIRDEARENLQALPAFEHAVKEATRSMEEAPEVDQYRFNCDLHPRQPGRAVCRPRQARRGIPLLPPGDRTEAGAARGAFRATGT